MPRVHATVSHSFTMRVRIVNKPGMLARVLKAIADLEGDPGAIDVVSASRDLQGARHHGRRARRRPRAGDDRRRAPAEGD